jgi:hypothetical protein
MNTEERSKSGGPVLRHEEIAPLPAEIGHADDERIGAHIESVFGDTSGGMVWHEIVSERIHIDVHLCPPNERNPANLLVTSGMSAFPMNVPEGVEDRDSWRHAELCMLLPPDWRLSESDLHREANYWPLRLLKTLVRIPHAFSSWLGWGHSIPNGDPAEPYAPNTQLSGALIIPPFLFGEEFFVCPGDPELHIFQVLPVTAGEMAFKLDHGADALLDELEETFPDIYGPLDPARPSAV